MVKPWHTICGQAYAKVQIHPHIPRNTLSRFWTGAKNKILLSLHHRILLVLCGDLYLDLGL